MLTTKIKILMVGVLAVVMPISTVNFYTNANAFETDPHLDYVVFNSPQEIQMEKGERKWVEFQIQNVSEATWDTTLVNLSAIYPTNDLGRQSIWNGEGWTNSSTIPVTSDQNILPGKRTMARFEIVAPNYDGLYKERFALTIDGFQILRGQTIEMDIKVGNSLAVQSVVEKEIKVFRNTQQSNLIENGYIVATLDISSGKAGYTTPAGNYKIMNQIPEAYSEKYSLWMSNWMALISVTEGYQGYGLHSLAYWKTSKPLYPSGTIHNGRLYVGNRVYEDAVHLGKPMSHGCIRYGIEESDMLFEWADVGMPVSVI
ncbi:MAG: L,D-transpeptidase [Patescibacteria group bacterium]